MADLNLRNVPEEIIRSLKVDAAAENTTLRELCLRRLVPDGGESWKPQTVTGEPITRKEKKPIVTDRAKRQRFMTHVTDVTPVTEEKMITSAKQACDHHAIGEDEKPKAEVVPVVSRSFSNCSECGGMGGMHQKGCSKGKKH